MDISCEHYIFSANTACPQGTIGYTLNLRSRWMCKEACWVIKIKTHACIPPACLRGSEVVGGVDSSGLHSDQ